MVPIIHGTNRPNTWYQSSMAVAPIVHGSGTNGLGPIVLIGSQLYKVIDFFIGVLDRDQVTWFFFGASSHTVTVSASLHDGYRDLG